MKYAKNDGIELVAKIDEDTAGAIFDYFSTVCNAEKGFPLKNSCEGKY
jgi:hypothetical protein